MKLMIGENYRIAPDTCCFILEQLQEIRPKNKEPRKEWRVLGYYGNMGHMLNRIMQEEIKASEVETLPELIKKYDELKQWFEEQAKGNQLVLLRKVEQLESDKQKQERELRKLYRELEEKQMASGDGAETYTTGYRDGHTNGQMELLERILHIDTGLRSGERQKEG